MAGCFKHEIVYQHAHLRDDANNTIRFQFVELCRKCGKILSSELCDWDFNEGFYKDVEE